MKPTIQELDAAISILEEELRLIPFGTEFDWSTGSEESEKQYIQTKLQALKFARALMKPSDGIQIAFLRACNAQYKSCECLKAATEQAWEEVSVPKEVEGE